MATTRFSFKAFVGDTTPTPKATPKGPSKPRVKGTHSCSSLGHPTCARTNKEPVKVAYRVDMPGMNYRRPTDVALPDSPDLRRAVAEASLKVANAHNAFKDAVEALKAIGPLPDAIIQDMSPSTRRYLDVFKQSKPQAPEVPWIVIRKVKSASRVGHFHELRQDKLGSVTCTCEGFKYNNRCWVLDAYRADQAEAERAQGAPEKE